jgi:hypothetical protein
MEHDHLESARHAKVKFPRYQRRLRFDEYGVYSYGTKIAHLDTPNRWIISLGKFSVTSTRHYNYAKHYLEENYGFREMDLF